MRAAPPWAHALALRPPALGPMHAHCSTAAQPPPAPPAHVLVACPLVCAVCVAQQYAHLCNVASFAAAPQDELVTQAPFFKMKCADTPRLMVLPSHIAFSGGALCCACCMGHALCRTLRTPADAAPCCPLPSCSALQGG